MRCHVSCAFCICIQVPPLSRCCTRLTREPRQKELLLQYHSSQLLTVSALSQHHFKIPMHVANRGCLAAVTATFNIIEITQQVAGCHLVHSRPVCASIQQAAQGRDVAGHGRHVQGAAALLQLAVSSL